MAMAGRRLPVKMLIQYANFATMTLLFYTPVIQGQAIVNSLVERLLCVQHPISSCFHKLEAIALPLRTSQFLAHNFGAPGTPLLSSHGQEDFHRRILQ